MIFSFARNRVAGIGLLPALQFFLAVATPLVGRAHDPLDEVVLEDEIGRVMMVPTYHRDGDHLTFTLSLVNGTGQPLKGVIAGSTDAFQEVLIGGQWMRSRSFQPGCGNTGPARDLAPGASFVLGIYSPLLGDSEGMIRYTLMAGECPPISSTPARGRFWLRDLHNAGRDIFAWPGLANEIRYGLENGFKGSEIYYGPEDFVAMLELDRHYDQSALTRGLLNDWLIEKHNRAGLGSRFVPALREVLHRPWERLRDEPEMFHRCLTALAADSNDVRHPYGSPERCRAAVWHYLAKGPGEEATMNPERRERLKRYHAAGNPWGASRPEMEQLVGYLEKALDQGQPPERAAAGMLLSKNILPIESVPDRFLLDLLAGSQPSVRQSAVTALLARGKVTEVGVWLSKDRVRLAADRQLFDLWSQFSSYPPRSLGPLEDWELPVVMNLIDSDPLPVSSLLVRRYGLNSRWEKKPVPPLELRESVRRYLVAEILRPQVLGRALPPVGSGDLTSYDPTSSRPLDLAAALVLLNYWEKPEDTALLRQYLDHPGAVYALLDKGIERRFLLRDIARRALLQRGESVPHDLMVLDLIPARH